MSSVAPALPAATGSRTPAERLPGWWPLAALAVIAAALRLSTLNLQSFWYDEAFTPVHVLRPGLGATLHGVVHHENNPPLWYLVAWLDARLFGTGAIALRMPSAIAGIATVPVAWGIGGELGGRRTAILSAALVAVDPLFVWYSQEARDYGLFIALGGLSILCFLRFVREPTGRRAALFALTGALALLTHYFEVFLLAGMALWLLAVPRLRRPGLPALAAFAVVGLALLPLISAQGGHGTQWIGSWPLSQRLQAIPQYLLTGYSGAPLGHGIELLVALPMIAGVARGLWLARAGGPRRELALAALIAACGVLIPLLLAAGGADYLAPRNLVAAMVPVLAAVALLMTWPRSGRAGALLAVLALIALSTITIDVDLSPRLQRGNWHGVARALSGGLRPRVITTVELGSAPLEYYVGSLRNLHSGESVAVREIDETGYAPLVSSAGEPPAAGFRLSGTADVNGLIVFRFTSQQAREVSELDLRAHAISLAKPEVLTAAR